ncbi:hypothetical protein FOIG_03393 [Fusarium odoratissimum NRRL 54006]|uniref:Uncharacterized protein n=1 Tax=Fusarium odoratissimum (strain NRRL 54006) TaxID=1089451 RepID=X0KD73_FUSO5|nr:uncharacterized protein FOIG_03393 [Fusarium odoratissimum NRRL 54006]EXM06672.1 hypothetical protein FOIG_03393 [Fusarium odoratissimum NRRL 54006]
MWSLLENVSEKRVGVENFNSDARDVLQARVTGGFDQVSCQALVESKGFAVLFPSDNGSGD